MIRSLRTGVSGLKANQTRLDVVGNNIANANTVAFKRGRAAFSEVLGQQQLGVGRTAGGSGINPSHVGLGVSVGSIDQNWEQGSLDNTGIQTDLALSGDGFFIASPKRGAGSDQRKLTRAGNFTFNQNGEFVTASGLNVQGWEFGDDGVLQTGQLKDIQFDPNAQSAAKFTDAASVGGNLSADTPVGEKTSVSSVVYDEQGTAHDVLVDFTRQAGTAGDPDQWSYSIEATDAANSPFTGPASGTISFNTDGSVKSATDQNGPLTDANGNPAFKPEIQWSPDAVGGGQSMSVDLGDITQYSGSTTTTFQSQSGHSPGELAGYSINPEGVLELNFTNGEQKKLFQMAIGNVNNPNGLEQQGENFYTTSTASGDLQLGRAGRDLRTSVVAGALESSNVDLATEFTEMIVAQRGYQASARVVTTSDELLQETMQLKR